MISHQSPEHVQVKHVGRVGALFSYWHFAALFIVLCALFVLRRPDSLTNPQFWAEDGHLLFQGQLLHGSAAWIFEPYRGYLIVNTKLVAAFAALFPVVDAPLIYNISAILIASLACSLFALPSYRHLVRSDPLRIIACFGAAGALYTESLVDNISNSQWYLALIGFLLLFRKSSPKQSWWLNAACAVMACLAALTNPVLVIAAPICLWQLTARRNKSVASAMLAAIVVQIGFYFFYRATSAATMPKPGLIPLVSSITIATVYKVVISSMLGSRTVLDISNSGTSAIFISISILIAIGLIWLFMRLDSVKRVQMLVGLYLIVASVALPMSGRGLFLAFRTTQITERRGEQYFFIAGCVLLFLIAVAIERVFPFHWKHIQGAVFIFAIAGGFYENFSVPPLRDLKWPAHAHAIEMWSSERKEDLAPGVVVPLNPSDPPIWFIRLPATLEELTITGFPDHIELIPMNRRGQPMAISSSSVRDCRDFEYIDLPIVLESNTEFDVRAVLKAQGPAIVSLLIHGRLDYGTLTETRPTPVVDDTQLRSATRTDSDGRLCIHLRRISGSHATFRSIIISRQAR